MKFKMMKMRKLSLRLKILKIKHDNEERKFVVYSFVSKRIQMMQKDDEK
jgi:hypothetical protein